MTPAPNSRTVRVFLSSTFRDFAGERDLLVKTIFPELRRRCRARQVELVDVDLRWGITEEEAQQGKVLPICLAEIDRSRPYFMGFLGERYGWVPEAGQYDRSLLLEQPWLEEKKHLGNKSVTELEILHGVLDNPAMEKRAFFYFRDPAWSEAQGGAYLAEGPAEQARLAELKERIRQSGFPFVENYAGPEELAERVREDLWQLIDEAYPESEVPDALTRERMTHEAYGASRLGLYLGGEPYFAAIDAAVTAAPRRPILVTGESGGGKSALLANWASRFARQNPTATLLSHYLAVGADAAHPVNLVIRILREISRFTGEELTLEGDPRKALHLLGPCHLLGPWLAKAGTFALNHGGAFVLVLDGLDKMDAPADLGWWPADLPEGVAMVASCLPGGIRDAVTQRMHWETVSVSPLGRVECAQFIKEHLEKYRKSLLPVFTERILDHPLSGNPLFLRTLLEELRVFGVHEELEARIDHYLASLTIDDLFERVLERVESDNSPESVRAFLEILWAAKESFAEDELLAVSGLPPAAWAPIHIALDESLIGNGGRVAFSHDYLKKAVQDRYLPTEDSRQRIRERLATFCAESMREGRKNLSPYVRRHAVAHLLEAGDWDGATAALADLQFIEARAKAQELPAMLVDYALAERLLPEGAEERKLADERQAELDRYARELVEYAAAWTRIRDGAKEAEPALPRPVKSVQPWSEERIAAERQRMTDSPNRLDRVKAFRLFVATNTAPLQTYSTQEGFLANLAHNDAPAGPVHEAGARQLEASNFIKCSKQFFPNEIYEPSPSCIAVLEGHEDAVEAVRLSLDGYTIASGSRDGTIRIWDCRTGECRKAIDGHQYGPVYDVDISRNGCIIVSAGADCTGRVWNAQSGEQLKALIGHDDRIESVCLSDDSCRIVSGGADGSIRIWSMATGKCIKVLKGHEDAVFSVSFSPDGSKIQSKSKDRTARIWDAETGDCAEVLDIDKEFRWGVTSEVWSADGKIGATATENNRGDQTIIRIWKREIAKCWKTFSGHTRSVSSLAISADGTRIVSGGEDGDIRIWNVESGVNQKIDKLQHDERVNSLAINLDSNTCLSASNDGVIILWDINQKNLLGNCIVNDGDGVESVALSGDGRRCIVNDGDGVESVALSGDGRRIAAVVRSGIAILKAESGNILKMLRGHEKRVWTAILNRDGRLAVSGSADNTLRIWDVDKGECLKILEGHKSSINAVALSVDDKTVFSGSQDHTLRAWDIVSGKCLGVFEGHAYGVNSLFPSADQKRLVSGSTDLTLRLWNLDTGECLNVLRGHTDWVHSVVLSADGRCMVSGSGDNTLRIWSIETGMQLAVFFLRGLTSLTIDGSSRRLAVGFSDGRVEFYQIENLLLGPFITTAQRELVSEDLPVGPVTARPACCGQVIAIPPDLADRIEHWHLAGHDRGDSAYTDPALLLDCPSCGTPLRMNPFFVDVRPWSVD